MILPSITAQEMKKIDDLMVFEYGISILQMMENDARSIAVVAKKMLDDKVFGKTIVVCAGKGNNGGGGLAAARHLHNWGAYIKIILTHIENDLSQTAKLQLRPLKELEVPIFKPDSVNCDVLVELKSADLIIDAILGYSINGNPYDEAAELIHAVNKSNRPVLANDLPSGLHPETGIPYNPTVRATSTITLALPKKGLLAPEAKEWVGNLYIADIGIPFALYRYLHIDVPKDLFANDYIIKVRD